MPDETRVLRSRDFALAVALAALAGWVDAVAFVRFAGIFVSFMSGNSTRLAAWASAAEAPKATLAFSVLAGFVAGVIAGEAIAIVAKARGHAAALFLESLILLAATAAAWPRGALLLPAVLLAVALGIQNASLHEAAGMRISLTYVTGTLVRLGRRIARALFGKGMWSEVLPYLFLWLGLMAGAAVGACVARACA